MKLIQIAINVICIALVLKYNCVPVLDNTILKSDMTKAYLSVAVIGGFFVISALTLLAYAIEGMSKAPVLETLMMVVGSALSFANGGLILDNFINHDSIFASKEFKDAGISFGSLQVVNGLAYLIDAFFVFKK